MLTPAGKIKKRPDAVVWRFPLRFRPSCVACRHVEPRRVGAPLLLVVDLEHVARPRVDHDDAHALEPPVFRPRREGDGPRRTRFHAARNETGLNAFRLEVDFAARDLRRLLLRDVEVPRCAAPGSDEGEGEDGEEEERLADGRVAKISTPGRLSGVDRQRSLARRDTRRSAS